MRRIDRHRLDRAEQRLRDLEGAQPDRQREHQDRVLWLAAAASVPGLPADFPEPVHAVATSC